ncbi:MAG: thioredoxin domain-containing protein [Chloroflexota bacterium]
MEFNLSYRRNNLGISSSPYLLQHSQNPVWWQEWSGDVIKYALEINRPLFVSVGYATCHWCHVMASEAFSDEETADFLNENFINIKVDREQRPDIDQFLMDFITRQTGSGGWPLNVFLTPSLRPVYALTYAPAKKTSSFESFLSVAKKIIAFYGENKDNIREFKALTTKPEAVGENSVVRVLSDYYDPENGGFGTNHKFPPHSTLLYLLYQLGIEESPSIRTICTKTLDAIMHRGLNDHLQGGIFRYCVDPEWTIPHFEKMLYDQAMALWVFSLAYRVTGNGAYKQMSEKILRCINESFFRNGLYISAHDADTEHLEGITYLWRYEQLEEALTPDELKQFTEVYAITPAGNFRGGNHLVRMNDKPLDAIEEKLLDLRRKRKQPSSDDKILSGLNALTAAAMIQAARHLDIPLMEGHASRLVNSIKNTFWRGSYLGHSMFNNIVQEQPFLFDAAALLFAVTLLYETDESWGIFMDDLERYVVSFRSNDRWIESKASDFPPVNASWFDHPVPSSVSLAEAALTRYNLLREKEVEQREYLQPFQSDFYNLDVMVRNGLFHVYTSADVLDWSKLPVNSIQTRGAHEQDCYMGVCRPLDLHGKA